MNDSVFVSERTARKLIPALLVFVAIAAVRAAAPVALQENASLAVRIVLSQDATGNFILPHGEAFEIGITNLSDQPIKIWEEKCQSSNRSLTFRVKIGGGEASIAQKRDIPKDVWIRQLGYLPRTRTPRTLPPKTSETRSINFSEFFWGERAWQDAPEPNSGEKVRIQAVFEIAPEDEARTNGVWTGKIESAPLTVLVVTPKLKTAHEYLWNGCSRQALKVLKSDPSWIKKSDDMQCTPLHHAARFGPKEELLAADYLQVDETLVKVIPGGNGKRATGYLWVAGRPGGDVISEFYPGRGKEYAKQLLGEFKG